MLFRSSFSSDGALTVDVSLFAPATPPPAFPTDEMVKFAVKPAVFFAGEPTAPSLPLEAHRWRVDREGCTQIFFLPIRLSLFSRPLRAALLPALPQATTTTPPRCRCRTRSTMSPSRCGPAPDALLLLPCRVTGHGNKALRSSSPFLLSLPLALPPAATLPPGDRDRPDLRREAGRVHRGPEARGGEEGRVRVSAPTGGSDCVCLAWLSFLSRSPPSLFSAFSRLPLLLPAPFLLPAPLARPQGGLWCVGASRKRAPERAFPRKPKLPSRSIHSLITLSLLSSLPHLWLPAPRST